MRTNALLVLLAGACLGLCPALLGTPRALADEEPVTLVRLHDVGPLVRPPSDPPVVPLGLPPALGAEEFALEDVSEEEPVPFLAPDALAEILLAALPSSLPGREEAVLVVRGTRLEVGGTAPVQEAIATLLADLWREASRRVWIEAAHLRLEGEAVRGLEAGLREACDRGRLSLEQGAALWAAAAERASASTIVRPGGRAVLGQTTAVSYVGDYDVEIAQDSAVGDPIVLTAQGGWQVDARPFLLRDGSVHLEVFAEVARIQHPIRQVALEAEPFGSLDLPRCRVLRLTTTTSVRPAEFAAIVDGSGTEGGDLRLLLLRAAPLGLEPPAGSLRRLDVGALVRAPVERGLVLDGPADGVPAPRPFPLEEEVWSNVFAEDLIDLALAAAPPETWEEESAWVVGQETCLVAHHRPEVLEEVQALLGDLERAVLPTWRFRLLLRERVDGEEPSVLGAFALDLPMGRRAIWQSGHEAAYVADWDVEVAQEARVGDPNVRNLFEGLALQLRADPSPVAGEAVLWLDGLLTSFEGALTALQPRNECTGIVEVPALHQVRFTKDVVLQVGVPAALDLGRAPDGARRIELEVRLER